MISLVATLVAKGMAYQADDGSVYFAIAKFPGYGKLSRLDTREVRAGARVSQDEYSKENAQDFALWKAAKPEDEESGAAWDSPWGRGRPGWHLECSAMAMRYLGETMDIHCGGIDLVFPHHEDEIAQSEGATGKPFARLWSHGEFLLTDGSKMAKRIGNVATVEDLREQGVSAAAFRHFVFSTHYRKQLNLSGEALEAAQEGSRRIGEFAERLKESKGGTEALRQAADDAYAEALALLSDDLNAPAALGVFHSFIRRANAELDQRGTDKGALRRAVEVFEKLNGVFDVVPEVARPDADLAAMVEGKLAERKAARAAGDFGRADAIRAELGSLGIVIEDGATGTKWKKAP
jgi:cysteinyl-tRNA synthetase